MFHLINNLLLIIFVSLLLNEKKNYEYLQQFFVQLSAAI
jgi:hypothetical protein